MSSLVKTFILILCVILGGIWFSSAHNKPLLPSFVVTPDLAQDTPSTQPIFESAIIPQPKFLLSAHSATIEHLSNGNLIALWFAGSHEAKPDVKIWQSTYTNGSWGAAHVAVSPAILSQAEKLYIRIVGNPVVYARSNGVLDLFVVSVSVGGWSGSGINHLVSYNNGASWSVLGRIKLSPFFNISTLVRTTAVGLSDGGFYLPVYYEISYTYPELLRFDKNGKFIETIRVSSKKHLLQPSLIPLSDKLGYIYFRHGGSNEHKLFMQTTHDAGVSWGELTPTNLTNHDSSLAVVRLSPKLFLMVHNIGQDRSKLALSVSHDGVTWSNMFYLEYNEGYAHEFSYPAIAVNGGMVDIVYTWERKYIKHVRFNQAWLAARIQEMAKKGNNYGV